MCILCVDGTSNQSECVMTYFAQHLGNARIKPQFRRRGQKVDFLRPRIELNAQFGNYNSRILSISVVDTVQRGSKKSEFSIGKVGVI